MNEMTINVTESAMSDVSTLAVEKLRASSAYRIDPALPAQEVRVAILRM